MPYSVVIGDRQRVEDVLNGAIHVPTQFATLPLGGLTLIFNTPSGTVTFSGAASEMRTTAEVVAEINAVHTGLASLRQTVGASNRSTGEVVLQADAGVVIDSAGTANALFGLSTSGDTTSAGAVDAADVTAVAFGNSGQYIVILAP